MKALLMKDLYVFWRRMKLFVLMIVVFCAVPGGGAAGRSLIRPLRGHLPPGEGI